MKKLFLAALFTTPAMAIADPAVMLGLAYNFGGAVSVTFKVLSTNRQDRPALAAGVSYAPWRDGANWSWDTGVAYNFRHSTAVLSYDWVPGQMQVSFGAANLKSRPDPVVPVTEVAPPPPPLDVVELGA